MVRFQACVRTELGKRGRALGAGGGGGCQGLGLSVGRRVDVLVLCADKCGV